MQIDKAILKSNSWLKPFGLTLEVETSEKTDGRLGDYDAGSVFEKTIRVIIYPDCIAETCVEESEFNPYSILSCEEDQIQITIFHELGHALVEQIIDWMENLPNSDEIFTDDFCQRYESVIDDGLDEETLVEDFAYAFMFDKTDPLKACFEELNKIFEEQ